MNVAKNLAAIAAAEVGVTETAPNSGPRIREYQKATWLQPAQWAWCAAFVCWCLREWIKNPATQQALKLRPGMPLDEWRCRDARAYGWEEWARKRGLQVLDEKTVLRPGDIVTFDFSHIGIVEEDRDDDIVTIEGNTNSDGAREGDGVYRKKRARGLVRAVIRILEN